MKLKCIAIAYIDCNIAKAFVALTFQKLEEEISRKTSPLKSFNISLGEIFHATEENFDKKVLSVSQSTDGPLLNYLHARRAGVLSLLRPPNVAQIRVD